MTRSPLIWPITAAVAAAGVFYGVRMALPSPQPKAFPVTDLVQTKQAPLASPGSGQSEDPLLKRLRFLDELASADSSGLRQMFQGTGAGRQEKRVVAQRWAETDPAGLLGFLKGLSRTDWDRDGEQFDAVRGILFRTWAAQDPEAALAAAEALGNRPQFRTARWEIVQSLFGMDPAKAFAAAVKLPQYLNEDRVVDTVWKKDPSAFLKAAGDAPPGAFRNGQVKSAVDNAFGELLKQDPLAAAAWLKSRPLDQQRKFWGGMAYQLAEADPAGAQAWFKEMPPSAEREKAGAEMVKALAKKDPNAALEWLQDNLEGGRTAGFAFLAEALAEKGVDSAKQLLEAMPPGEQRDGVVKVIAQMWANKYFKPAIAWVLSLPPDDPGRKQALQQLGYQWAGKDLAGAAAYLRDQAGTMESMNMMHSVTSQFVEKDMGGGFAWADTLPANAKARAYSNFFQNAFSQKKLPEVFAAVEKLPVGQQETIAGKIAAGVMNTRYSDTEMDTRFVNSLKLIPPHLRQTARDEINKSNSSDAAKKQAALEALK
ncbi:MAG: hypothetical protein V4675_18265 [Verrucomicrobiota bacterium]